VDSINTCSNHALVANFISCKFSRCWINLIVGRDVYIDINMMRSDQIDFDTFTPLTFPLRLQNRSGLIVFCNLGISSCTDILDPYTSGFVQVRKRYEIQGLFQDVQGHVSGNPRPC
jgi:hypothetical protein